MYFRTCEAGFTKSDKRFVRRCRQWLSATLIVYFALNMLLTRHWTGLPAAFLAGAMGCTFFTLIFLFALLVVRSGDEFRRVLLLRSFLWATVVTMFGASVYGFIEAFSDRHVHLPLLVVPAFLVCATAAAKVLIFRKHRAGNEEPAV